MFAIGEGVNRAERWVLSRLDWYAMVVRAMFWELVCFRLAENIGKVVVDRRQSVLDRRILVFDGGLAELVVRCVGGRIVSVRWRSGRWREMRHQERRRRSG